MHKSQIFSYLLGAFLLGVLGASVFAVSGIYLSVCVLAVLFMVAVAASPVFRSATVRGNLNRKKFFVFSACVLVMLSGAWRFHAVQGRQSIFTGLPDGAEATVRGYVDGDFSRSAQYGRFPFRITEVIASGVVYPADEKILVNSDAFPRYMYGDKLRIAGTVQEPENFDGFDYVSYLRKDGIYKIIRAVAVYRDAESLPGIGRNILRDIYRGVFFIRDSFRTALEQSVAEPNAAYITGVLLGARTDIPDDLKEAFNRTSTSHILAISGYNITILAQVILSLLLVFIPRRRAFWASVVAIGAFTVMTGASSSVVRAAVMGLLALFASSYGRLSDVKNALLLAGAVMVAANPMTLLFDTGFQLSFLAVAGLIYIEPVLNGVMKRWTFPKGVRELLAPTLSAQIAVAPLIAFYFGTVSLVALPANILVLPVVPFLMALGFMTGGLGMLVPVFGHFAGFFAWAVSSYQLWIIGWFSSLSFASLDIGFSLAALAGAYGCILILLLFARRRIVV